MDIVFRMKKIKSGVKAMPELEKRQDLDRMKELIVQLTEASKAYYAEDKEIMSNFTYDKLYDELQELEEKTGMTLSGSPTTRVGYEVLDELPKEAHESPMLSLDKTKDREELRDWLQDKEGLLSWKLDGLTIVLTYRDGELQKAVTRGNGEIGEVITNNARVFTNIPLKITYKGELILRGEAVITYSDFNQINKEIEEADAKYKNPRNLCSGSVRQLNNEMTAKRRVKFFAFSLVKADGVDFHNAREEQFAFLEKLGFDVVEYYKVDREDIFYKVAYYEEAIGSYDVPSDGLVLMYNDIAYGESLGATAKFPRDSIAFKWADEVKETRLLEIEWSASRTGLINPVAIFEPVELEGTTVSRASVHNISILRALELGIGDSITVYKANMIIPQIAENLTRSATLMVPKNCPVCQGITEIRQASEVQSLYCTNPECPAKKIKAFTLFVSRDAMNIEGLSEATLEKLIDLGFVQEFADIYHLEQYADKIQKMEGFGEKSYQNLMHSIEVSRHTTLPKVIYSLGIENIGVANAKMICKEYGYDLQKLMEASVEELSMIDGVGEVIATAFWQYFQNHSNVEKVKRLLEELILEEIILDEKELTLKGKVFVITGSLHHYDSRKDLKEEIEKRGGKVTGSVTGKTDCLINNDTASQSSKNKKAKEMGVKIISEDDFIEEFLGAEE